MKYNKTLFPFKSKWVEINNHRIHYIDEGQGPVILFSHAPLASSFMYRKFIGKLKGKYRCIAIDYPGFGLSEDKPGSKYSIVSQSEVLKQLIVSLKISDIIGVGHDTGGPSLFHLASEHPDWFKGFILTDTIIYPTYEYRKIHTMLNLVGSNVFQSVNARTNFLLRLTYSLGVPSRKLTHEELRQYTDLFNTPWKRKRITQLLYSLRQNSEFMLRVKSGFENQLNDKPTLLIYGENDPVRKIGIPERIHSMMKNSELFVIKKESHFPHEGDPDSMIEIIDQWLEQLDLRSGNQSSLREAI